MSLTPDEERIIEQAAWYDATHRILTRIQERCGDILSRGRADKPNSVAVIRHLVEVWEHAQTRHECFQGRRAESSPGLHAVAGDGGSVQWQERGSRRGGNHVEWRGPSYQRVPA